MKSGFVFLFASENHKYAIDAIGLVIPFEEMKSNVISKTVIFPCMA
ncbi:hypothetical protein [Prochlorococcus marinus]|nr:hypothetical protein [Prochlorococcus marinus]MBO8205107.1 hypothetical protein [Prochlorococcus marinus CUG1415]